MTTTDSVRVPREWFFGVQRFLAWFTSGNSVPRDVAFLAKQKGRQLGDEATALRDMIAAAPTDAGELVGLPPSCGPAETLDDRTLVDVALQSAGRLAMYGNKVQHDRLQECKGELLRRLATQHRAAVDGAMVERAREAYYDACPVEDGPFTNAEAMRAALAAALQEPK